MRLRIIILANYAYLLLKSLVVIGLNRRIRGGRMEEQNEKKDL